MFRYIGFSWTVGNADQCAVAQRLGDALRSKEDWQLSFAMAGQCVYTTGTARGINSIYRLPSNRGVVLGRLFRRNAAVPPQPGDIELSEGEGNRIARSDGRSLVDEFWGRYVAFLPSWTGHGRVLRDPTGTLPCYRVEIEGIAVVMSWLDDVASLPGAAMPPIDWLALATHMLLGRLGGRATALEGVSQIMPGELTPLGREHGDPLCVWNAAAFARRAADSTPAAATTALRETTISCVQSWASCYESIMLRLSGGVDSSIVLGSLRAGVTAERLVCLNYHSPGSDSDERHFARLVAQRGQVALVERALDEDFRMDCLLDAACTPAPANYIGGMGLNRTDARETAEHRADVVFTGTGGDLVFFEFHCTWPATDYLKLRGVGTGFLEAALDAAHLGRVSFWAAIGQAIKNRHFRVDPLEGAGQYLTLMRPEAMDAAMRAAHDYVHPAWRSASDLPIGKFNQLISLFCPTQYYSPFMGAAAPEYVHPLLSQPLLELCLATPTFLLTLGGRGRALARKAFAEHVPHEISTRRSKGGMEEYITKVLQRNLPFAREVLLDGFLVREGLLDRERVEAALSGRAASKATYVAEVHACIAVETWIRRVTRRPTLAH